MLAACGGGDSGEEPAAAPGAEAGDPAPALAQVVARGTLTLSTDLRYPPQSFAVKRAKRAPGSRCPANQLTAPQVAGYDADTGELVAKALGVEPCFVTPSWTEITAGKWSDRWDIAFGSGAITADRNDQAVDDRAVPDGGAALLRARGFLLPPSVGPRRQAHRRARELQRRAISEG
ncbi:MAG TPA: transporter substrate-binding domain-containing protein [Solirubrobacteraceae bacterium]